MSESDEHKRLVVDTARRINELHPELNLLVDGAQKWGFSQPPIVEGHRPDIFAHSSLAKDEIIIAEIKTSYDLNNNHTHSQLKAFTRYISSANYKVGTLVLSVFGDFAAIEARTLLRYSFRTAVSPRLSIQLFDGLNFWSLGGPEEIVWQLLY